MFYLASTNFTATYMTDFLMDASRKTTIPNGYYLQETFGTSSTTGSWTNYPMGTYITQRANAMLFEYDYRPTSYSISYTLNGGTNSSSNPSSYNVLYAVSLASASRTGYTFNKWTIKHSVPDLTLTATSGNYNYAARYYKFQPGDVITIKINSATRTAGSATQFRVLAYDFTTNTSLANATGTFGQSNTLTLTIPSSADGTHNNQIIIYAGLNGSTANVGAKYTGITIENKTNYINKNANATFSSPSDMYNQLNLRNIGNVTATANWSANTYTVTLNQQGGSGGTTSVSIVYDTPKGSYPTITRPTKSGHSFGGYYTGTNGTGTQYYDANGNSTRAFQIASNTTWYAYWIPNTYNVAYNANGGTSTPATQSGSYGSNITLASAISKNNVDTNVTITITYNAAGGSGAPSASTGTAVNTTPYTFNKWALNSTSGTTYSAGASFTIPASNSTMYATWTAGTTTRKSNPSIKISTTTPTKTGYVFKGWCNDQQGSGRVDYVPGTSYTFSESQEIYAVWEEEINHYIKVNGAWKEDIGEYIKVNGAWKEKKEVYRKVNGSWTLI